MTLPNPTCESCTHASELSYIYPPLQEPRCINVKCTVHGNYYHQPFVCGTYTPAKNSLEDVVEDTNVLKDLKEFEYYEYTAEFVQSDRSRALEVLGEEDTPYAMEETALEVVALRSEVRDLYEMLREKEDELARLRLDVIMAATK